MDKDINKRAKEHRERYKRILDDRGGEIERIAKRFYQQRIKSGELVPLSEEQIELYREREELIEKLSDATNRAELDRWRERFIEVHKKYLSSLGLLPCAAYDCTKIVTGRKKGAKYCCTTCKERQAARRQKEKDPVGYEERQLRYYKSVVKPNT